jgi:hypothetical protein
VDADELDPGFSKDDELVAPVAFDVDGGGGVRGAKVTESRNWIKEDFTARRAVLKDAGWGVELVLSAKEEIQVAVSVNVQQCGAEPVGTWVLPVPGYPVRDAGHRHTLE